MPLLMCPNCQASMKEITREGVLFDMCPECHGVWLDRGELQKLLEASRQDLAPPADTPGATAGVPAAPTATPSAPPAAAVPPPQTPPGYNAPPSYPMPPGYHQHPGQPPIPPGQPGWHRHHDDSDDDYYKRGKYYGKPYRRKSAMERIFDIFD